VKWSDWKNEKIELLREAGLEDPSSELREVISRIIDRTRPLVLFDKSDEYEDLFPMSVRTRIEDAILRRCAREPLAYILGEAFFYRDSFRVGPGVLIPRQDTEILVGAVLYSLGVDVSFLCGKFEDLSELKIPQRNDQIRIIDLCTGSGCIGISIANVLSNYLVSYKLMMTEYSEEAAFFARKNIESAREPDRLFLAICDLFPEREQLENCFDEGKADLIVANPPYIADNEMKELIPEVGVFEPITALRGGEDGLHFYRRILSGINRYLLPGGILAVEHGFLQKENVGKLFADHGFECIHCLIDFGGCDRVTIGRLGSKV
jgi:release factor glutamine methyltransferase